MIRCFVALELPEPVRFELQLIGLGLGLPDPVPAENLHLTLAFLGELGEAVLDDVDAGLRQLRAPGFELTLAGLDMFGGARPRTVHVGVRRSEPLERLQAKVAGVARAAGVGLDGRRFTPHVTLERLRPGSPEATRLAAAVAARSGLVLPPVPVEDFRLYSSRLRPGGSVYEELARYPLG